MGVAKQKDIMYDVTRPPCWISRWLLLLIPPKYLKLYIFFCSLTTRQLPVSLKLMDGELRIVGQVWKLKGLGDVDV